ncbi:hypothetical protein AOQ84DRAFT_382936 [Glonium stellatum]|uniref:Uncharacterized protein n=1 Tax=Glonium stellatum TaxID=574774 RepID=A0A8E2JMH7_9PEZI|nr:hypothetical protein AOQ84DRAFT_382936 [Glonium stellatum]
MAHLVRNVIGENQSGYVKECALRQWLRQTWPNMDIPVQLVLDRWVFDAPRQLTEQEVK